MNDLTCGVGQQWKQVPAVIDPVIRKLDPGDPGHGGQDVREMRRLRHLGARWYDARQFDDGRDSNAAFPRTAFPA